MRRHERVAVSHTSNPPPILLCPTQTGLHAGLGHVQGHASMSGFWAPPHLPLARFPTPTPHSTNMPQPCCPSASPAAWWSRVRCSLRHLQRATQRCRFSTSDRRPSVCLRRLRPHALDEKCIRSEAELTIMQMPWDAMSSSAKTLGSLRTATHALQESAQVGNIVRRGNRGGELTSGPPYSSMVLNR